MVADVVAVADPLGICPHFMIPAALAVAAPGNSPLVAYVAVITLPDASWVALVAVVAESAVAADAAFSFLPSFPSNAAVTTLF